MKTSCLNGEKLPKNSLLIHLIGTIDELNAHIGLVKAKLSKDKEFLESIQLNLMKLMSHISDTANKKYFFTENEISELEKEMEKLKKNNPEKSDFILPGKNETNAIIHIARTVARRAERYFAAVNEQMQLCEYAAAYLNKLSNYLYYLC